MFCISNHCDLNNRLIHISQTTIALLLGLALSMCTLMLELLSFPRSTGHMKLCKGRRPQKLTKSLIKTSGITCYLLIIITILAVILNSKTNFDIDLFAFGTILPEMPIEPVIKLCDIEDSSFSPAYIQGYAFSETSGFALCYEVEYIT